MLPRLRAISFLALGLLTTSLALSGCRPKITAPSEPPLAVRLGDDAFRLQDYEAAIEDYGVYIDSVERGEYTPLAFYQTGLCWYRLEQYEQTLDVLDELDRRYQSEHWVQVDALRGDAQYKLGRRSAALIAWDDGWRVAEPNERPELRRRIVTVLREMDEDELVETREVVRDPDVLALVEHHLAVKQGRPVRPGGPVLAERKTELASAETSDKPKPKQEQKQEQKQPSTSAAVLESKPGAAPSSSAAPSPSEDVAERAEDVSAQADELARLSDELEDTGGEMFEAIEDTKQAEGEIRAVDESTATYAPLLKVEIPEPPFVDRPVPEPKKRLRVVPTNEPQAAAPAAPIAEESLRAQEVTIVSGPPVELEQVDAATAAAIDENPQAAMPVSGAKVACILPLTGGDRAVGERLLRSIRLVFGAGSDQIVFRDSGSDPEVARQLVTELSGESDILIAIAPMGARDARSIAGSAERAAVPLLLVSSTTVPKTRYVLPVAPEDRASAESFAAEYRERYGSAPPGPMDSQVHRAALLAKQALLIAPVSRREVLSRLAAPPSAAFDSAS